MSSSDTILASSSRSKRIGTLALALSIFFLPAVAAAAERCAKVQHVKDWDFLYIRARPDYRSHAVGAIDPSTTRPILLNGPCIPQGASPRKAWCPVSYQVLKDETITGYVKEYYINIIECNSQ